MHILQITSSYKPAYVYGGPTMSVSKLCENVKKYFDSLPVKYELEVLTTTANGVRELPVATGTNTMVDSVPVTYFNRITKDHSHFSPKLLLRLRDKLRTAENDCRPVVHVHAWWNLVSILSCSIALMEKAPVILSPRGTLSKYSFHNRTSLPKRLFHQLIGRYLLERCHVHVTSEKEKNDILRLVKPRSITVIPNFVQLPHNCVQPSEQMPARKTSRNGQRCTQLIFLSRIEEKKGLDLLFQALSQVAMPWTLTIAGDGKPEYIRKLKDLATDLHLHDRLHWLGHLNNEEKFPALKAHDLLVLPSFDENFANVVIESIAMGTPVLLSDRVGLADYVRHHNMGLICQQDPLSIKDCLNAFLLGEIAVDTRRFKNRIEQDFNETHLADQYIELYKSLIQ